MILSTVETHPDVVRLTHAALCAYRERNVLAQVSTLDQIRAFVAEAPYHRGVHLTLTALLHAANELRAEMAQRGCHPDWWVVARRPQSHQGNPADADIATELLSVELNTPQLTAMRVANELKPRDLAAACSLVTEAMWAAAAVDVE